MKSIIVDAEAAYAKQLKEEAEKKAFAAREQALIEKEKRDAYNVPLDKICREHLANMFPGYEWVITDTSYNKPSGNMGSDSKVKWIEYTDRERTYLFKIRVEATGRIYWAGDYPCSTGHYIKSPLKNMEDLGRLLTLARKDYDRSMSEGLL
jgi:hypothetical protein